ncbi:MAG: hypothetical protein ACOCXJ_06440, partial [Planctomycetota bacterium]
MRARRDPDRDPSLRSLPLAGAMFLLAALFSSCQDQRIWPEEADHRIHTMHPAEADVWLRVATPETIPVGSVVNGSATVVNDSERTLHDVRIRRVPGAGAGDREAEVWEVGTVEPGGQHRVWARFQSNDAGVLRDRWYVSYDPSIETSVVARRADLELEQRILVDDEPTNRMYACEQATVHFTLHNTGSLRVPGGIIRERLPDGLRNAQDESRLIEIAFGSLEAGASIERVATLHASEDGNYQLQPAVYGERELARAVPVPLLVMEPQIRLHIETQRRSWRDRPVQAAVIVHNTGTDPAVDLELQVRGFEDLQEVSFDGDY